MCWFVLFLIINHQCMVMNHLKLKNIYSEDCSFHFPVILSHIRIKDLRTNASKLWNSHNRTGRHSLDSRDLKQWEVRSCWTSEQIITFHKMWKIFRPAEGLLITQGGLCSMDYWNVFKGLFRERSRMIKSTLAKVKKVDFTSLKLQIQFRRKDTVAFLYSLELRKIA
jgi:hypothetical protein